MFQRFLTSNTFEEITFPANGSQKSLSRPKNLTRNIIGPLKTICRFMYRLFCGNDGICDLFTEGVLLFHKDEVDLGDNCKEMLLFRRCFGMRIQSAKIIQ